MTEQRTFGTAVFVEAGTFAPTMRKYGMVVELTSVSGIGMVEKTAIETTGLQDSSKRFQSGMLEYGDVELTYNIPGVGIPAQPTLDDTSVHDGRFYLAEQAKTAHNANPFFQILLKPEVETGAVPGRILLFQGIVTKVAELGDANNDETFTGSATIKIDGGSFTPCIF